MHILLVWRGEVEVCVVVVLILLSCLIVFSVWDVEDFLEMVFGLFRRWGFWDCRFARVLFLWMT